MSHEDGAFAKHLMTPEVLTTLIWPVTLIILAFILCIVYLMHEIIQFCSLYLIISKLNTKPDTEKSNIYIGRMINSPGSNRQSIKINARDGVQVATQSDGGKMKNPQHVKINNSINTEQQQPKRKPKMSKPSSAKKEKEELPQESHAIQLLSQIYDMTQSLLHDTREVIKKFDQNEGISKNSTEAFASLLRDLGSSVKATNPEYTAFLEKQAEIYDELGHLQRRLQYEFSVRVVTPLIGWLQADFARINAEMKRMDDKKTDYDLITAEIARNPRDAGLLLQQDLCRQEYERQMELTKLELLRLSEIQNDQSKIMDQFALAWKEYTAATQRFFDQLDLIPSKMTGSG